MFSVMVQEWTKLNHVMTQKLHNSKTLTPLEFSLTITTTHASFITTEVRTLSLKQPPFSHWLLVVFHSFTTVPNNTSQEVTILKTVSHSGSQWTQAVTFIRSSLRSTLSAKSLLSGTKSGFKDTQHKTSTLSQEENSWSPWLTPTMTKILRSPTIPSPKERLFVTSSTPQLIARPSAVAFKYISLQVKARFTFPRACLHPPTKSLSSSNDDTIVTTHHYIK